MKNIALSSRLLVNGALKLARAIKTTYGPYGGIALIEKNGLPFATRDGATLCREIYFENPAEEMGSRIVLDAATKVENLVGDATSTTIILTAQLLQEGQKLISAGYCPIKLCSELEAAKKRCLEEILPNMRKKPTPGNLKNALRISLHEDEEAAKLITRAVLEVGRNGTVSIEDGESVDDVFEVRDGFHLKNGWESSSFLKNEEEYIQLEGAGILLVNDYIFNEEDIIPALEEVSQFSRPLLVVSHGVLGKAKNLMVYNRSKGVMDSCTIRCEGNKFSYLENLKDIQALVGGEVVDPGKGMDLKKFNVDWLGFCRDARVYRNKTTLLLYPDKNSSAGRIQQLRSELDSCGSDYDKDVLRGRIARLSGGYGVLKVGGYTTQEKQEKKSRFEDALLVAIACTEGGLLPSGGGPLVFMSDCLNDGTGGFTTLKKAFEGVFKSIFRDDGPLLQKLKNFQFETNHPHPEEFSFNTKTGNIENLWEMGRADSYLGLHHAIEKSVSASCQVLRSCVTLHS